VTTSAIDDQRYRADPRDLVRVQDAPKTDSVVLPSSRRAKEWLRSGQALREELQRARKACEAEVKDQRKQIQVIDRAIQALDATMATFTPAVKAWSTNHEKCIDCGTTTTPHKSLGRCVTCESRLRRDKKKSVVRGEVSASPSD